MENLTSKSNKIIELTKKICEAVANENIELIKKYVPENLILIDKFLGKKYKKSVTRDFLFDKSVNYFFQIVSPNKPFLNLQNEKAKITFECSVGFTVPHKRFTFKGGFHRNVFYYSIIGNDWKLAKVEYSIIPFSRNNLLKSWDFARSFFSQYEISTVR